MDEPTEDILNIKPGDVTVRATITHKYAHRIRNGNLMTDAVIADKTGTTKAVWFSKHPKEDLAIGSEYIFSGKYQLKYGRLALQSPEYEATGEEPNMAELAQAPLILPARNYPVKKSFLSTLWSTWPDWIGGAIIFTVVIWALAAWGVSAVSNYHKTHTPTAMCQGPTMSTTVTGDHNGIAEIHTPGSSECNSKCTDVTSIDYDWDDDVLCTRPDGSKFYTNYAGGQSVDPSFTY